MFSYLPKVTARKLAQCVGKVISMMPVIGNIARLMTKRCYVIIENTTSWDSVFVLKVVIFALVNNYMEGSGSATIKYRSPSQAPKGRGNLSKQKPHNYR